MIVHHIKTYKIIFFLTLGLGVSQVYAQENEEKNKKEDKQDLGTEVVNVVKPYTPTISDAFKVKATPKLSDSVNTVKKKVTYSIFSAPVASTFTPAKGKAAAVKKAPKLKLYDNYATLGFGSFTSVLAEFYSNFQISRTEDFGVFLNHNSSQGGIDDVLVDDFFYDTRLNLNYGARERDFFWRTDLDVQHQVFNWYGISPNIFNTIDSDSDPTIAGVPSIDEDFDVAHSYITGAVNGNISFKDAIFKEGKATIRFLSDSEDSNELRVIAKPTIEIPIAGENITTAFTADYVTGSFANNFDPILEETNHSILNVGFSPSLVILRDDLTVNLGVAGFVSLDSENSETDVFVYPKITASYRVVSDYFIAYAGLEGNLKQNSYYDFVQENPFLAPSLAITPTDQQYDGYLGIKGKLSNSVSYNLRVNYASENNKALFQFIPGIAPSQIAFLNGNSFDVVYDDVETLGVFGELNFDVNSNFKMKVNAHFNSYTTDNQAEAWNLPELSASIFADYQITQQWFVGVNLFFVGEREDLLLGNDPADSLTQPEIATLDSYLDANAHVGYRFNERLSAFGRVNNILNSDYQKWLNYEVQGLQGMIGATYKFDF